VENGALFIIVKSSKSERSVKSYRYVCLTLMLYSISPFSESSFVQSEMPRFGFLGRKVVMEDWERVFQYNPKNEVWSTHWLDIIHGSPQGMCRRFHRTSGRLTLTSVNPIRMEGHFIEHDYYRGYWINTRVVNDYDGIHVRQLYFEHDHGYLSESGHRSNCFFELRENEARRLFWRVRKNEAMREDMRRRQIIHAYLMSHH
jgi:hypothetical protein